MKKGFAVFCTSLIGFGTLALPGHGAFANEEKAPEGVIMEEVVVTDTADIRPTGTSVISADVLEHLPAGNATLTDMLKVLPGVQFDEAYGSALSGGEILPPEVSISGGRFYENYFSVDGTGNNSMLDPTQKDEKNLFEVPGHSMEMSPDPAVLESLTVYDSNVPASFGGFTGGVVDAKTRVAGSAFSGSVSYRTTRDSWSQFHLSDEENHQMFHSKTARWQPRFKKETYGMHLDVPVTDRTGVLFSYRRDDSTIPLKFLGGTKDQTRQAQNIFIKASTLLTEKDSLDISFTHSPYEGEYFHRDALNSKYRVEGGGMAFRGQHARQSGWGDWETAFSWRRSENNKISDESIWYRWAYTPSKNWGDKNAKNPSSMEGGYGSIEKEQETLELTSSMKFKKTELFGTTHAVELGGTVSQVRGKEKRLEDSIIYSAAEVDNPNFSVDPNDPTAVPGEQYFTSRMIVHAYDADADIVSGAAWVSDNIRWNRLRLRPGVRITHDDYLENTDVAPRLSVTLDVLGNGRTILNAGANRYYGHGYLAHKLREERGSTASNEWRSTYKNQVQPWELAGRKDELFRFSDLDTPYSDEVSVGIQQRVFGGRLTVRYVERENKDEFATKRGAYEADGNQYDSVTNEGSSDYQSVRVSWGRKWAKTEILGNFTWQESYTDAVDFDDVIDDTNTDERIWYNGQLTYLEDLPKGNYARPWITNLTVIQKLPWGLSATAFVSYKSTFDEIKLSDERWDIPESEQELDPVTGKPLATDAGVYEKKKRKGYWQLDLRLKGTIPLYKSLTATWDLEVKNALDTAVRTSDNTPLMGRQFWAGLSFEF